MRRLLGMVMEFWWVSLCSKGFYVTVTDAGQTQGYRGEWNR